MYARIHSSSLKIHFCEDLIPCTTKEKKQKLSYVTFDSPIGIYLPSFHTEVTYCCFKMLQKTSLKYVYCIIYVYEENKEVKTGGKIIIYLFLLYTQSKIYFNFLSKTLGKCTKCCTAFQISPAA